MLLRSFGITICIACVLGPTSGIASEQDAMALITSNISSVCAKPESAGTYWGIKIKGDGKASLNLKLADLGVSGDAEFTKEEWNGIKSTVEDSADYRDCVKTLTPMFLGKFAPIVSDSINATNTPKKTLGGIQWVDFKGGVEIILERCLQKGEMIECTFSVTSTDSDALLRVVGTSAVYDQLGRKYWASYAKVANFASEFRPGNSSSRLQAELTHKVSSTMTIRFVNIKSQVTRITKVSLPTYIKSVAGSSDHKFDFRDVDIKIK